MECTRYFAFQKGDLQGFADLYIPKWNVEICGCRLFMKNGKRWVTLPSTEYADKDGGVKYRANVKFRDENHWKEFCKQAKDAIDKWCKENPNP